MLKSQLRIRAGRVTNAQNWVSMASSHPSTHKVLYTVLRRRDIGRLQYSWAMPRRCQAQCPRPLLFGTANEDILYLVGRACLRIFFGTIAYLSQSCSQVDLSSTQAHTGESLLPLALIRPAPFLAWPRLLLRNLSCYFCPEVSPFAMTFPARGTILEREDQDSLQSSVSTVWFSFGDCQKTDNFTISLENLQC
jgi:hypothetical protein